MSLSKDKTKILFVCLGNICRSPAAEGVMKALIKDAGLSSFYEVDSAGTYGGHSGELPDKRMRLHASRRGYNLSHQAKKIYPSDFYDFDYIVAMDGYNYENLLNIAPSIDESNKVVEMASFLRSHPYHHAVPDPYYEGAEGFELVLDLLEDACNGMLDFLENNRLNQIHHKKSNS